MNVNTKILKAALAAVSTATGDPSRALDVILAECAADGRLRLTATNGHVIHSVTVKLCDGSAVPAALKVTFTVNQIDLAVRAANKGPIAFLDPRIGADGEGYPDWQRPVPAQTSEAPDACFRTYDPEYIAAAMTAAARCQKAAGAPLVARLQIPLTAEGGPARIDADGLGDLDFLALVMGKRA